MNRLQVETQKDVLKNEISREALKSELRPSMHKSLERFYKKSKSPQIPNHEQLLVGDIVLSRPMKNGVVTPSVVETTQIEHGYSSEAAYWTHVSLYVGDLHIIESQGFKDIEYWKNGWRKNTGVQVKPITKYSSTHDVIILRNTHPEFSNNRGLIARFALLDHTVFPRKYDWNTALEAAPTRRFKKRSKPKLDERINCSEFILECYAIGGSVLVPEYVSVSNGEKFFLPATFYQHKSFEKIDFDYLTITNE